MSLTKDDHVWSRSETALLERKIGETITEILRQKYAGKSSPMKRISKETRIAINTIRKWYSARTTPSLAHFMILAQSYPVILRMFLEASGYDYLTPHIRPEEHEPETMAQAQRNELDDCENGPINGPINFECANLNERQVWFLTELSCNRKVAAGDIAQHCGVGKTTAKRDIRKLKQSKLIQFIGAKKTGFYEIVTNMQ